MSEVVLLLGSVLVAATAIALLRGERFLQYGALLVYGIWHLPLVLSVVLPYSVPFRTGGNVLYVALILGLIHVIVFGGLLGVFSARQRSPVPPYRLTFGRGILVLAWSTPVLLAVEAFALRGVPLSLDVGANRAAFSAGDASVLGQVGILLSGVGLFVLLARPTTARNVLIHVLPFVATSLIFLSLGNRQYMLQGLIIFTLNLLADRRPRIVRTILIGSIIGVIFGGTMVQFGMKRQWQTAGLQDEALKALLHIQIDDYDHPLTRSYALRTASLYLFVYYGVELDLAAALIRSSRPEVPITSLTLPIVYRRVSHLLGLPAQTEVMDRLADTVSATVGIYPNVWRTMFSQIYMEAGIPAIALATLGLACIHFLFTRRFVSDRHNGSLNGLIILYFCLIFGVMYIATREGSTVGLLLFWGLISLAPPNARQGPRRARKGTRKVSRPARAMHLGREEAVISHDY